MSSQTVSNLSNNSCKKKRGHCYQENLKVEELLHPVQISFILPLLPPRAPFWHFSYPCVELNAHYFPSLSSVFLLKKLVSGKILFRKESVLVEQLLFVQAHELCNPQLSLFFLCTHELCRTSAQLILSTHQVCNPQLRAFFSFNHELKLAESGVVLRNTGLQLKSYLEISSTLTQ